MPRHQNQAEEQQSARHSAPKPFRHGFGTQLPRWSHWLSVTQASVLLMHLPCIFWCAVVLPVANYHRYRWRDLVQMLEGSWAEKQLWHSPTHWYESLVVSQSGTPQIPLNLLCRYAWAPQLSTCLHRRQCLVQWQFLQRAKPKLGPWPTGGQWTIGFKKDQKKNDSINFRSQYVCRSMVPPKFSEAGFGLQDILVRKDKCRYSLVAACAKSLVESKWAYPESISRTPKTHVCPTEPSYSKRKPGLYNLIYIS